MTTREKASGEGASIAGRAATGLVTAAPDGSMAIRVAEEGLICTAVITEPKDKARGELTCSDGNHGHAILRLRNDGSVKSVVYFRGTAGSGTIDFDEQ